jgi:type IV pilus assembly protein PilM
MFDKLYIELENDAMRYVYGSMSGKNVNMKKWGIKSLTKGCFANGKVMGEAEFIKSLSELKKELKIFRCTVHLTVNDGSFITRPIELPILKEKDIEKHLSLEAEQYLPINKENFQVGFRVMERRTESVELGSSVMVSAGPKENIENILKCFDRCRLDAKVIDVYPNNICRMLEDLDEEDFAVIDMGRRSINITIIENRKFYMHTYIPVNMEALFEDYIKDSSIGIDEFQHEYFYESFDTLQINKDETPINASMRDALAGILGQVSRYLDYFNSRHFGKTVDNVYVIGENGMLRGLRSSMSNSFNTKVTIGIKPFPLLDSINKNSFLEAQMGYHSLLGMILRGKRL